MMKLHFLCSFLPLMVRSSLVSEVRRLAVDASTKDECGPKLESYYNCEGIAEEASYTYGDDAFSSADFCASLEAASEAATCGLEGTCQSEFLEYVGCYSEAHCGKAFSCATAEDETFTAENWGSVAFYNVFADPVCFSFGLSSDKSTWQKTGAVSRTSVSHETLLSDSTNTEETLFYEILDGSCSSFLTTGLQAASVATENNVIFYGPESTPRAFRVLPTDEDSSSFVFSNEAASSCTFAWRNTSVSLDATVAQSRSQALTGLTCSDVSLVQGVDVTCGSKTSFFAIDPKDICADTTVHFVATSFDDTLALNSFQANSCAREARCDLASLPSSSSSNSSSFNLLPLIISLAVILALVLIGCFAYSRYWRKKDDAEPAKREDDIGGDRAQKEGGEVELPEQAAPKKKDRTEFNSLL